MDNGKHPATPPHVLASPVGDDEETPKAALPSNSKQRRSLPSPGPPAPATSSAGLTGSLSGFLASSLRTLANTLSPETAAGGETESKKLKQTGTASTASVSPVMGRLTLDGPAQIGTLPAAKRNDSAQSRKTSAKEEQSSSYFSMLPGLFGGKSGKDSPSGVVPGGVILGAPRGDGGRDLSLDEAHASGQVFEDEMSSPVTKTVDLKPITPKTSQAGRPASRTSSMRLHEAVLAAPIRRTTLTQADMTTETHREASDGTEEDHTVLDPISRAISSRHSGYLAAGTPPTSPRVAPPATATHNRAMSLPFAPSTGKPSRQSSKDVPTRSSVLSESTASDSPSSPSSSMAPDALPSKPKKTFLSRMGIGGKNAAHKRAASASAATAPSMSTPISPASQMPKSLSLATSLAEVDPIGGTSLDELKGGAARSRYIKVRTKNKAKKELKYLFLAQELHIPQPGASTKKDSDAASIASTDHPSAPLESPGPSGKSKRRKKPAVWAMRFSHDGQYLAAAGQDGIVRVWQVNGSLSHLKDDADAAGHESLPTPSSTTSHDSGRNKKRPKLAEVPVFASKPVQEFVGHTADVLDISWSKNNFLLSSSMDKTVRLWHVSRPDCLSAFMHLDVAVAVAFHPLDDRFFLSGSLDCKLRLWNVPDKRVHAWTELSELITTVAFANEGKLAVAGSFVGRCTFFEIETFRYNNQIVSRSGKTKHGKKVTSIYPLPDSASTGQEKILVTTNDSSMRLFNLMDRSCIAKYRGGHANDSSQIRGSFSEDGRYIITGSEDRGVYIYDSGLDKGGTFVGWLRGKEDRGGYETFAAESDIATCCIFAPEATRTALAKTGDLIFGKGDALSPVGTRISRISSQASSQEASRGLEDAIIVCADDHTGIIRIYRNSTGFSHPATHGFSRRGSHLDHTRSRADSTASAGITPDVEDRTES